MENHRFGNNGLSSGHVIHFHVRSDTRLQVSSELKDAQMVSMLNSMKRLRDIELRGNVKVSRRIGGGTGKDWDLSELFCLSHIICYFHQGFSLEGICSWPFVGRAAVLFWGGHPSMHPSFTGGGVAGGWMFVSCFHTYLWVMAPGYLG